MNRLFVLGASGNVGQEFLRQVYSAQTDNQLVVGLVSSTSKWMCLAGFNQEAADNFFTSRPSEGSINLLSLIDSYPSTDSVTFVDVTAVDTEMREFHKRVIQRTNHKLVTANKNPLAGSIDLFQILTADPNRYEYSCSVMAGAGTIDHIRGLRLLHSLPSFIEGTFSGTLAYICSELERGIPFSEIVRTAKEMGYTEPHPANDLDGSDVAKKILILARTGGYDVNYKDIEITPFIDHQYLNCDDVGTFLDGLTDLDQHFRELADNARKNNNRLAYVARFDGERITVGLEEVPKHSALGTTQGRNNKVVVVSRNYPKDSPYMIEAPGAGREITAENIRRDINRINGSF